MLSVILGSNRVSDTEPDSIRATTHRSVERLFRKPSDRRFRQYRERHDWRRGRCGRGVVKERCRESRRSFLSNHRRSSADAALPHTCIHPFLDTPRVLERVCQTGEQRGQATAGDDRLSRTKLEGETVDCHPVNGERDHNNRTHR